MSDEELNPTKELQIRIFAKSSRVEAENYASTNQDLKLVDSACQVMANTLSFQDNQRLLSSLAATACCQSFILDIYKPLSNFIIRLFWTISPFWTGTVAEHVPVHNSRTLHTITLRLVVEITAKNSATKETIFS